MPEASALTRVLLAARPTGAAGLEHFRLETAPLPEPGPGQVLARVIWLSLDPYMRGRMNAAKSYAPPAEIGAPMPGGAVAEIMVSRHPGFAPGDLVVAPLGWVSHGLSDGTGLRRLDPALAPLAANLGIFGMPGLTAWVGLNDIAAARPGETIVVSAATGAVGSVVGQLARRKGLRVIGLAGGAAKCAHAMADLGYDLCLDHRAAASAEALSAAIAEAAPQGVDIYFDNTAGRPLQAVLPNLKTHGRIALCGMVGWFTPEDPPMPAPALWGAILRQRLRVQGFIVFDHDDRRPAFEAEVAPLLRAGHLTWRETVAEGLAAAPAAFLSMLGGGNLGKQLVRVGPDPG